MGLMAMAMSGGRQCYNCHWCGRFNMQGRHQCGWNGTVRRYDQTINGQCNFQERTLHIKDKNKLTVNQLRQHYGYKSIEGVAGHQELPYVVAENDDVVYHNTLAPDFIGPTKPVTVKKLAEVMEICVTEKPTPMIKQLQKKERTSPAVVETTATSPKNSGKQSASMAKRIWRKVCALIVDVR